MQLGKSNKGTNMSGNRVVVTGLGLITPVGLNLEENWTSIINGRSGIRRIEHFDVSDLSCQIAGLVTDFDASQYIEKKEIKRIDPFIQFALAASSQAMEDAGLTITDENAHRVAVVVGSGMGGLQTFELGKEILHDKGPSRISPFHLPSTIANLATGRIAIRYGAKGPNFCIVTACSAGTHSIGHGYRLIRHGYADAVISGGTEACVTRLSLAGFCAMRALTKQNDPPEEACRPFDKDRDGFIMGEGAGVLILEEYKAARKRGAPIYGEIIGYGESGDAYHIAAPSPDGEGALLCMNLTLRDAGLDPSQIEYINAHGTSTPYNDYIETLAIKALFKDHARRLAISSTKSMTGHLIGATGAVEAIYTLMALKTGIIPPTINYQKPDPECDLDYVPNQAREQAIEIAMSNSFGFGGTNSALIFKKC